MNMRRAEEKDLYRILSIYNQGIEDRIATLETEPKDEAYMYTWFKEREPRFVVLVAEENELIIGWASINVYNKRKAYRGVGELSVYIDRNYRGKGIGKRLLQELERLGREYEFHKFVLFTFSFNELGQALYKKAGYLEVGVFQKQGMLDGKLIDVMAMEKLL